MMKKKYDPLENSEEFFASCPVITTLSVIGGKWKPAILWQLQNNDLLRFGQLKKRLGGITQKMLTQQLRELEANNIILRKIFPEVPPRVEYKLSDHGKSLAPLLNEMANWGANHNKTKEE